MNICWLGKGILSFCLLCSLNSLVWAAGQANPASDSFALERPPAFGEPYNETSYAEELVRVKTSVKRKIAASNSLDPNVALTAQYRGLRDLLIGKNPTSGVKTAEELQKFLDTLSTDVKAANKYTEPDVKLLSAQLLMLKPFHGFFFRTRNIFDMVSVDKVSVPQISQRIQNILGERDIRPHAAHALAITVLRLISAGIDTYLPTDQWKAGFAYVTQPYQVESSANCSSKNWTTDCDIPNEKALQVWLRRELLPQLIFLEKTLESLNFQTPVYVDNQLLYGSAQFTSVSDQVLRLGEVERLAMLSGVQGMMSGICGINAYELDGLIKSIDDLAKVYGFQSAFSVDSATSQDRYRAIKGNTRLFKKKQDEFAKAWLNESYEELKKSLDNAHLAWQGLDQNGSADLQQNVLDPRVIAPFSRVFSTGFQNAYSIAGISPGGAEGPIGEVMSAVVNGEKVIVHLKEFFIHPPDTLQDFLPQSFEQASIGEKPLQDKFGHKVNVRYRNYSQGEPKSWKYAVYGQYFEGVNGPDDIRRVARVLSQSWGGFLLGGPLALVMF